MKSVLLILVSLLTFTAFTHADDKIVHAITPPKWECKQVPCDANTSTEVLQSQLNTLGDQGWELTGIIARRSVAGADTLLFKRLKESDAVTIEFQPEMGVVIVRGTKNAVEKTLSTIQAIENSANEQPKP